MALRRMVEKGVLTAEGRGIYRRTDIELTEHHSLAEVTLIAPNAVICLLSALHFHGLTTQSPFEVWVALDVKARKPKIESPPIRVVRFSGSRATFGVEHHTVEGVDVRVTSLAKTVADCFRYRNKIGLDVALEALREYKSRRCSMDELYKAMVICRVDNVARPYLEAIGS